MQRPNDDVDQLALGTQSLNVAGQKKREADKRSRRPWPPHLELQGCRSMLPITDVSSQRWERPGGYNLSYSAVTPVSALQEFAEAPVHQHRATVSLEVKTHPRIRPLHFRPSPNGAMGAESGQRC